MRIGAKAKSHPSRWGEGKVHRIVGRSALGEPVAACGRPLAHAEERPEEFPITCTPCRKKDES